MRRHTWGLLLVLLLGIGLGGCTVGEGGPGDDQLSAVEAAQKAREQIDELAAMVGTSAEVTQDEMTSCYGPFGEIDESRSTLFYGLHVQVTPEVLDRLYGEIADHYEAEGWRVVEHRDRDRVDPDDSTIGTVSFHKDGYNMGVSIFRDTTVASVGGSSPCAEG